MIKQQARQQAAKAELKVWANGLGADCGGWEILYPINPMQPYRARWFPQGDELPVLYGEGKDIDDAIDKAELY